MPNTIAQNLQRLVTAKNAISSAITAKGGTVNSGDGLEEFPADIATIPAGSYSTVKLTSNVPVAIIGSDSKTRVKCSFSAEVTGDYTIQEYGILYSNNGSHTSADFTINDVDGTNVKKGSLYSGNILDSGTGVVARGYVKVNNQYIYTGNIGGSYADLKKAVLTEKTITANGTYTATSDNADGYSAVTVNIPKDKVELSILSICLKSDGVTGQIRASSAITVSGNWTMSEFGLLLCTDAVANTTPLSIDNIGEGSPPIQRGYRTDASTSPYTAKISDANNNGVKFCGYMVLNSDINKIVIYTETKTVSFGELLAPSVDVVYEGEGEIEFECHLSTIPKDNGSGNSFNVDQYGVLTLDSSSQITQPITVNTSGVTNDTVSDGSSFVWGSEEGNYFYIRTYARIGTRYYYGKQIEKRL